MSEERKRRKNGVKKRAAAKAKTQKTSKLKKLKIGFLFLKKFFYVKFLNSLFYFGYSIMCQILFKELQQKSQINNII